MPVKKTTAKKTPPKQNYNINQDIAENSGIAAFSYISFMFLIPLLFKTDSKFAQFHAKQGMVLFGLELLFFWFPPLMFILIITAIIAIVKTLNGEHWSIPILNTWSKKINL